MVESACLLRAVAFGLEAPSARAEQPVDGSLSRGVGSAPCVSLGSRCFGLRRATHICGGTVLRPSAVVQRRLRRCSSACDGHQSCFSDTACLRRRTLSVTITPSWASIQIPKTNLKKCSGGNDSPIFTMRAAELGRGTRWCDLVARRRLRSYLSPKRSGGTNTDKHETAWGNIQCAMTLPRNSCILSNPHTDRSLALLTKKSKTPPSTPALTLQRAPAARPEAPPSCHGRRAQRRR